jgi:hypothetical protein
LVIADHIHLQDGHDWSLERTLVPGIHPAADQSLFLGIEQNEPDRSRQRAAGR